MLFQGYPFVLTGVSSNLLVYTGLSFFSYTFLTSLLFFLTNPAFGRSKLPELVISPTAHDRWVFCKPDLYPVYGKW